MKKLIFSIPILGIIGLSMFKSDGHISQYHIDGIEAISNSVNPSAARTGAPGESTCTSCHSGSVMSGDGVIFFTVGGGPSYTPGETYPLTISTVGGPKNGFEITILDSENNQAGTFTAGANNNVINSGGRQYVRQSVSAGQVSWSFDWTAPVDGAGELTAYYVLNKSNNNGSTSGDEIFINNTSIPQMGASVEENELEKGFVVYYNTLNKELNLNYLITNNSKVVLNIQDLSGRLVEFYDFGIQTPGSYQEKLQVSKVDKEGIYLVSLLIDNRVLNRKIKF